MSESIIPITAIIPAVLEVTMSPDIDIMVTPYTIGKFIIRDDNPWPLIVVSTVPISATEYIICLLVVDNIIRPSIGY